MHKERDNSRFSDALNTSLSCPNYTLAINYNNILYNIPLDIIYYNNKIIITIVFITICLISSPWETEYQWQFNLKITIIITIKTIMIYAGCKAHHNSIGLCHSKR